MSQWRPLLRHLRLASHRQWPQYTCQTRQPFPRRLLATSSASKSTTTTSTTTPHTQPSTTSSTAANSSASDADSDNIIRIVEVGPRDGLQNEKRIVPLATKIQLIERLAKTGLTDVEAGAFVSPKWVPQMADSDAVLKHLLTDRRNAPLDPVYYSFLVPNTKGLESALDILKAHPGSYNTAEMANGAPDEINTNTSSSPSSSSTSTSSPPKPSIELSIFAAATETFSRKNLNCSIAESLDRFAPVITAAKASHLRVRAYISVCLGCPFEGYSVSPTRVAEIAVSLLEMGADEISLGDTTGMGTVPRTSALLSAMAAAGVSTDDLAMHFHDTYGQALVNTAVSLEKGIRTFDASVAGLGGCPFAPGASGNVGTEDMVYFMGGLGMDTGVDLDELAGVGKWIAGELGVVNGSRVSTAWAARKEVMMKGMKTE